MLINEEILIIGTHVIPESPLFATVIASVAIGVLLVVSTSRKLIK
jgi:hypothetical protein